MMPPWPGFALVEDDTQNADAGLAECGKRAGQPFDSHLAPVAEHEEDAVEIGAGRTRVRRGRKGGEVHDDHIVILTQFLELFLELEIELELEV